MNEMKVFSNDEFGSVRAVTIGGEPYFVGKDVADILGYSNTRDALSRHVDDEDKNTVVIHDGIPGNPNQVVINESGLYSLILSSKLPSAKRFKHWVTSEVLPSIRRHGLYAIDDIIANPDLGIAALKALKAEREKNLELTTQVAVQAQQLAEYRPKASYYDVILACPDAISVTTLAKDYGWSAQMLNRFLHEQKVQYRQKSGIWVLYQKYAELGFTCTRTHTFIGNDGAQHAKVNTYWTQKGRLFIYDLMKQNGHLPNMEKDMKE